ncbi:unnamed protein product [Lathyrus oleraceus]
MLLHAIGNIHLWTLTQTLRIQPMDHNCGLDDLNTMAPPVMRRAIGRPKKPRNKMNDEPRNPHILPRRFSTVICVKYGDMRHNKRSCKGKRAADRAIPKGGNKLKKTKKVKSGKGTKKSKEKKTKIAQNSQAPQPTQECFHYDLSSL